MSIKDIKAKYQPVTHYPPQCCASCEWLSDEGRCSQYNENIPLDWVEKINYCALYCARVPF